MTNIEKIMKYFGVDEVKAKKIQDTGINLDNLKDKFVSEIKNELSGMTEELEAKVGNVENDL